MLDNRKFLGQSEACRKASVFNRVGINDIFMACLRTPPIWVFLIPTTSVCKVLAERLGREGIVRAESTAAYWVFDFELCEVLEVAQHCLLYSI